MTSPQLTLQHCVVVKATIPQCRPSSQFAYHCPSPSGLMHMDSLESCFCNAWIFCCCYGQQISLPLDGSLGGVKCSLWFKCSSVYHLQGQTIRKWCTVLRARESAAAAATKHHSRGLDFRCRPWTTMSPLKIWPGGVCISFSISLTHFLSSLHYCEMTGNKVK